MSETMDLSFLSEEERHKIMSVLHRDDELRRQEDKRSRKMKQELQELRKKGAIKSGSGDAAKTCARCREPLGVVFNAGELCPKCQHKVCKNCKVIQKSGKKPWLCIVCNKQLEIRARTGEWFFDKGPQASSNTKLLGSDLVRASIRHNPSRDGTPVRGRRPPDGVRRSPHRHSPQRHHPQRHKRQGSGETVTDGTATPPKGSPSRAARPHAKANHTHKEYSDSSSVDISGPHDTQSHRDKLHPPVPPEDPSPESHRPYEHHRIYDLKRRSSTDSEASSPQVSTKPNNSGGMDTPMIVSSTVELDSQGREGYEYDNVSEPGHSLDSLHASDTHTTCSSMTSSVLGNSPRGPGDGADSERDRQSSHIASDLSDSEPEAVTEAMTGIAFHRMSVKGGPGRRSPLLGRHELAAVEENGSPEHQPSGSSTPTLQVPVEDEPEDIDKHFKPHASNSATSSPARMSHLSTNTLGSVDSLTSFYSSAGERNLGKITVTGDIKWDMNYNYKTGIFEVKIIACRDLAPVDTRKNFSDPYVKTYLLPDKTKSGKRKTKVKKHTLNPHYDETLKYVISESELQTRTLWISVWHNDAFGHNDFLGEIQLPLDDVNFEEFTPEWRALTTRIAGTENTLLYKGDLTLAIMYVPPDAANGSPSRDTYKASSRGRKKKDPPPQGVLHVHLREAKNLIAVRINGYSDPFAKCYLLPNKSKSGKRKTEVLKKNCNPKWDEKFVYEGITIDDLKERALEITLWDRESMTSNDFLGGLRLGVGSGKSYGKDTKWQDSRPEEMAVWQKMLDAPNEWIEANLMLRSHMNGKEAKEPEFI